MRNFENLPTTELLQDLAHMTRESFHRVCSTAVFDRVRDAVKGLKMGTLNSCDCTRSC